MDRFYFDWAATSIPDEAAAHSVPFGNPSSRHAEGKEARRVLENARKRCAKVLGVPEKHIFFTSGGTESNALVLHASLMRPDSQGILLSSAEHPSIRENGAVLARLGKRVAWVSPEKDGRVSPQTLEKALKKAENPRLVSAAWVNNEIGSVSDIPELVRAARGSGPVHFHCDMVQGIGKIPCRLSEWDLDSASMSAHKLGGPRGAGILYLRKPLEPLYSGGGQESGIRPGTENTAGAAAFADALERHGSGGTVEEAFVLARDRWKVLITELSALSRFSAIPADREPEDPRFSPYILQCAFEGIPGEVMARMLDDAGFAVSTGSACSSASRKRPVLEAMGIPQAKALEGIRISQGWTTGRKDIELLVSAIRTILNKF
ncbi:cysteine desulfurase family protein [Breznakiella homolactica]|uniref:Cysteine desulfurase n=1 Tax=Breznakiella homolactica TaxID=2798577 RepID=A0A7T7XKM5_9SPIR|nr:cysteine desulfurase family protein [Breznakiella homolactica]QQO08007.1 cysteine desulfurase [Breznakiella homolactica]